MDHGVKLHTKGRFICGSNAVVEGDVFRFKGAGRSVGVVKLLEPLSPMLNYYEYVIVSKGLKCAIGVGMGEQGYPLDRMPGWNRNGIGYHADDGRMFHQDGYGKAFGAVCSEGDRMGCGVDFDSCSDDGSVFVFFTRNGEQVGEPVRMKRPVFGLYPLIGMHSPGESVRYLGHWLRTPLTIQEPMELEGSPSTYWLRSNGVSFADDALTLEYCGNGLEGQDVGIAQARHCVDRTNHYFEMEILSSGREGWLALGLAKTTYPLHRHPGWNKGSVGYHADNGQLYKERGHGVPFGPECSVGDIMGCGIQFPSSRDAAMATTPEAGSSDSESEFEPSTLDELELIAYEESESDYDDEEEEEEDYLDDDDEMMDDRLMRFIHRRKMGRRRLEEKGAGHARAEDRSVGTCLVYFTKNGERVGETECPVPKGGFYPVVAMCSPGEKLRVNFHPLTG